MTEDGQTVQIRKCIERIRNGDSVARGELLNLTCDRLMQLTRAIKRNFQRVGRWEQTEDVFQNVSLRLYQAMQDVEIVDVRHFYRLAAKQIRRELIDLTRHHFGPQRPGYHHATQFRPARNVDGEAPDALECEDVTHNPQRLDEWARFHEMVEQLPDDERELFDYLYYDGRNQDEVADLLDLSVRSVKRRWRNAKVHLHELLSD